MSITELEGLEDDLRACVADYYTVPDGQIDEDTFEPHFYRICGLSKGELPKKRHIQLQNKFCDTCSPIIEIAERINEFAPDLEWLESLIWKTALAALEIGRRHGAGHEELIDFQADFHKKVPKLANPVYARSRWPKSHQIHVNLVTIYANFIKFYIEIINAYTVENFVLNQSIHSIEKFQSIIQEAGNWFLKAQDTYNHKIEIEEQLEASRLSESANTSSLPLTDFKLEFKVKECIGEGSHGTVYSVEESTTKELYACKYIRLSSLAPRTEDEVKKEILTLKKLRHTHIVALSVYCRTDVGFKILMQPLAELDLKEFMIVHAKQGFPPNETNLILSWFGCLLQGLEFAHSNKIKHKDIKPGNILVKHPQVYLSDFSLAKDFTGEDSSVAVGEIPAGTLRYRAPETRNNAGRRKADVFSLGCVYAEMLTVVCKKSFEELYKKCLAVGKTDRFRDNLPTVKDWLDQLRRDSADERIPALCKIIRLMMDEDIEIRHTAAEAVKSVESIAGCRCPRVHLNDERKD